MRYGWTALLLAAWPAIGLADDTAGDMAGVWKIGCTDGPCQAYFSVQAEGKALLTWSLLHDKAAGRDVAVLRLPVRVALPPGAQLSAGATKLSLPFQFCDPEACTAIGVIEPAMRDALAAATTARIAWFAYGQPQPLSYEVPITGFSDALARLAAR